MKRVIPIAAASALIMQAQALGLKNQVSSKTQENTSPAVFSFPTLVIKADCPPTGPPPCTPNGGCTSFDYAT